MKGNEDFKPLGDRLKPKPDFNYNKIQDASQENNFGKTWDKANKGKVSKKGE